MRIPGRRPAKLCHARSLDLRVGHRVVVRTEDGDFIGKVALTPRRREPYTDPYEIMRIATGDDERLDSEHRELGREVRLEAQKLARDHRIEGVEFIGCDVSLDGKLIEVKYQTGGEPDLSLVCRGLEDRYGARIVFARFSFIDRSGDLGGCDTCGVPLCCATWSGARSLGPINVRLAKQQGVTPNDKIHGSCGEIKCCMRYEHEVYKEFKERAPFKNTAVTFGGEEGKVVDYSMVKDAVLIQFGEERSDRRLVTLSELVPENPEVVPMDADDERDASEVPNESELSSPNAVSDAEMED